VTAREENSPGAGFSPSSSVFLCCSLFQFGPKRDEVTVRWRKLHNGELHNLYSSPDIIRQMKSRRMWAGHVARMGEGRNVYRVLVGKPKGKRKTSV
jgi:hypothetical protein